MSVAFGDKNRIHPNHIWTTPQVYGTTAIHSFFMEQAGVLSGADRNQEQADKNGTAIKAQVVSRR